MKRDDAIPALAAAEVPLHPDEMRAADCSPAEVGRVVGLLYRRHGYDFRGYAIGSLQRRIGWLKGRTGLAGDSLEARLEDPTFLPQVLDALTVEVSAMFRDPGFFLALRRTVVPYLRTYPRLRLWVAGCACGEEAYSLAILLREEGLEERATIYATDLNPRALLRAREGVYRVEALGRYGESYLAAGGRRSFAGYFSLAEGLATIDPTLRRSISFAQHDLSADGVFGEMQAIFCRNVLIYFEPALQNETLRLLHASLLPGGFLGLGVDESLARTDLAAGFDEIALGARIYRKRVASSGSGPSGLFQDPGQGSARRAGSR